MNASPLIVEGTLQPDGLTLRLEQKLALPPGRVTVAIQPSNARAGMTMLETLDRIHVEQQQRGRKLMTEDEMAGEIAKMRAEASEEETRWAEIWSQTKPQATDQS